MCKQLELGAVDLFSLEPVDDDLRPLRLKVYLNSHNASESENQ